MKERTCALIGYCPTEFPGRYNETDERCLAFKTALSAQIKNLVELGVTDFRFGMSEITDFWAAVMVLDLREKNPALKLRCDLSCEGQADRWDKAMQEQYQSILRQADSVEYVNWIYHKDCVRERNQYMVDRAEWLLAVWQENHGSVAEEAIRYAKALERKVVILDPVTLLTTHDPCFLTVTEAKIRKGSFKYSIYFCPMHLCRAKYLEHIFSMYIQNQLYRKELTRQDCRCLIEQAAERWGTTPARVQQGIGYLVQRSFGKYPWEWEHFLN